MTLTRDQTLLLQGAEEFRARAMEAIGRGGDPIVIAQDLHDAAESYELVSESIALAVRAEARARKAAGR